VTHTGERCDFQGSATPPSQGSWAPSRPNFWGPDYPVPWLTYPVFTATRFAVDRPKSEF